MIILGNRATAKHMRVLTEHLLRGVDNESITLMLGGEAHIAACIANAKAKKCTFAIRHFVISPHVEITDADALWIRDALADEFGFRRDFVTLVKHAKPRLNEALPAPHFHLLAAEFDPEISTKVLSSAWSFARHEKVARLAELYLGHRITPGPHQGAVVRHLEAEGETEAADALRPIDPPRAAADPRTGWDAPTAAPIVRANRSPSDTIGGAGTLS